MSDLSLVLIICGAALAFVAAFVALAISYTKISTAYEEVSLYDSRHGHEEPVSGRGDIHPTCFCCCGGNACTCDHKPGTPPRS